MEQRRRYPPIIKSLTIQIQWGLFLKKSVPSITVKLGNSSRKE